MVDIISCRIKVHMLVGCIYVLQYEYRLGF